MAEPGTQDEPVICEGDILCDRYRADRVLEHGGTGTVLSVTDLVRNEAVAIKMISADHGEGSLLLARLRREADILARLTSPHVVRVLDVAMHGRTLCLVMELLKGHNMARFVRRRGALPIPEAVGYIVQACDGLADAHSAGVVHRDVKPQNVFLADRRDGTAIVKVLDFGVAKQYSVTSGAGLTVGGAILGSPPYSAPEQLRDPTTVDGRADVWSIGLVLYYLLTRRNAFDAETFPALLVKIATQNPPSLRAQRPDVPEELEQIFLRCVEKEPAARFPDMASLARALTPFAPSWSHSYVPGIDARLDGRGSLASLPVIPLGPDLPEDTPAIVIVPDKPLKIAPEPARAAIEGAAEPPAAPSEPSTHSPLSTASDSPEETSAKPVSKADEPPAESAKKPPEAKDKAGDKIDPPAKKAAPESPDASPEKRPADKVVPNPSKSGGAPPERAASEGGALRWVVVALVAILAPALVGLVLFLIVQFGGCG